MTASAERTEDIRTDVLPVDKGQGPRADEDEEILVDKGDGPLNLCFNPLSLQLGNLRL